jgi:hypothetical protein
MTPGGHAVGAHVSPDEIVVFDKAYVDFEALRGVPHRGVCWVSCGKPNMASRMRKAHAEGSHRRIEGRRDPQKRPTGACGCARHGYTANSVERAWKTDA